MLKKKSIKGIKKPRLASKIEYEFEKFSAFEES